MKHFIIIVLLALTFLNTAPLNAGWFDGGERERRINAEQQLQAEQQRGDGLLVVVTVLGIGCVVAVVIGTILGSKARRHAND